MAEGQPGRWVLLRREQNGEPDRTGEIVGAAGCDSREGAGWADAGRTGAAGEGNGRDVGQAQGAAGQREGLRRHPARKTAAGLPAESRQRKTAEAGGWPGHGEFGDGAGIAVAIYADV